MDLINVPMYIKHASHFLHRFPWHSHTWIFQLPYPSPRGPTSILMTSLLGVLNTMLPSLLRAYIHSHGKSRRHIHNYVSLYTWQQPSRKHSSPNFYKSFPWPIITIWAISTVPKATDNQHSLCSCLKQFLVDRRFYQGNHFLDSLSLLLEHTKP